MHSIAPAPYLQDTGHDLIQSDGNDILHGQGGEGVIEGDLGDDKLFGGHCKDDLDGGSGDNKVKKSDGGSDGAIDQILSLQNPWWDGFLCDQKEALEKLDPESRLWLPMGTDGGTDGGHD